MSDYDTGYRAAILDAANVILDVAEAPFADLNPSDMAALVAIIRRLAP